METSLKKRCAPSNDSLPIKKGGGCLCERSKCLKLYCACFSKGTYCGGGCQCKDCNNSIGNKVIFISKEEPPPKNQRKEQKQWPIQTRSDHRRKSPGRSFQSRR